jgi:vitamin K-dependent gamma-carboxylase
MIQAPPRRRPVPGRPTSSALRRWSDRAASPVSDASLAVVRIVYGLVGVLVAVRTVANGWVESLYAGPGHHFTYPGFRWVAPPGVDGTYVLLGVLGLAAACVALGWRSRCALAVFLVAFGWLELVEVTTYLNHYWFVTLLGALLLVLPAGRTWSLDARRRPGPSTVPLGAIWLVRAQVAVVYVFAGLAKLNTDWLVHGLPLRLWLPARSDLAIVGPWLDEPWVAIAASWAGAAFDCLVVPALCWRRTRPYAWCALVVFHVATWRLFPIGVFPWVMIAASTVFFEPDWPRRLLARLGVRTPTGGQTSVDGGAPSPVLPRLVLVTGVLWIVLQVVVPLRHLAIPGDARWTNEGYRFAWVVLLTEKGGDVTFRVTDRAAGTTSMETGHALYTPSQWRMMATEPELIRQAAHAIAARHASRGRTVEVRADAFVSLNARPARRLVRSDVDLAREPWRVHQPWVLPAPDVAPLPGR